MRGAGANSRFASRKTLGCPPDNPSLTRPLIARSAEPKYKKVKFKRGPTSFLFLLNKLNNSHISSIAFSYTKPDNSCISTSSIFKTRRYFFKKFFYGLFRQNSGNQTPFGQTSGFGISDYFFRKSPKLFGFGLGGIYPAMR